MGRKTQGLYSFMLVEPTYNMQVTAKGYDAYGLVQGPHRRREQFKRTVVIEPHQLWQFVQVLPHFSTLLNTVLHTAPGREVAYVHILDQSSNQARFSWHVDNRAADGPGYSDVELSFVFCVTPGQSSMRVAGKREFWYGGAGQGVLFHSALYHQSGFADHGTITVAVFLKKM